MVRVGDVLTVSFSLAWKCGVVAIAVFLVAAMFTTAKDSAGVDLRRSAPHAAESITGDGETRVRMELPPGKLLAKYALHDEQGDDFVDVSYIREGVVVRLGKAFPVQPGLSVGLDGRCEISVSQNEVFYNLRLLKDGSSAFTIRSPREGLDREFGINKEGEFAASAPSPP
jgi:hypothetical protein